MKGRARRPGVDAVRHDQQRAARQGPKTCLHLSESSSLAGAIERDRDACMFVRLSRKPGRLYANDNDCFHRPRGTASGGRSGLSASEKTRSEIGALSRTHKKWKTPRVCATASRGSSIQDALRDAPGPPHEQELTRVCAHFCFGRIVSSFLASTCAPRTAGSQRHPVVFSARTRTVLPVARTQETGRDGRRPASAAAASAARDDRVPRADALRGSWRSYCGQGRAWGGSGCQHRHMPHVLQAAMVDTPRR